MQNGAIASFNSKFCDTCLKVTSCATCAQETLHNSLVCMGEVSPCWENPDRETSGSRPEENSQARVLEQMECVVPWASLVALIAPYYLKRHTVRHLQWRRCFARISCSITKINRFAVSEKYY